MPGENCDLGGDLVEPIQAAICCMAFLILRSPRLDHPLTDQDKRCVFSDIQHRFNGNFDSERALSETPTILGFQMQLFPSAKCQSSLRRKAHSGAETRTALLAGTACYT